MMRAFTLVVVGCALLAGAFARQDDRPAELSRVRIRLSHGRTLTCTLGFDPEGRPAVTSRALGEGVLIDFSAVQRFRRLNSVGRGYDVELERGGGGILRLLRSQALRGTLDGRDGDPVTFESERFGSLQIPRGDLGVWEAPVGSGGGDVRFVDDAREAELFAEDPARGLGQLTLTSGETLEISDASLKDRVLTVRSRYFEGERGVPFDDVLALDLAQRRGGSAPHGAALWFDAAPSATGTFRSVVAKGKGWEITHSEPGFLTETVTRVERSATIERLGRSTFHVQRSAYPVHLQLASGDAFPARIVRIDGGRATLETPLATGEVELELASIDAILFEPRRARAILEALGSDSSAQRRPRNGIQVISDSNPTRADLERTLQVPRRQKADPGTVILVAKNGDLVRTNLVRYDAAEEVLEVSGGAGGAARIPASVVALAVRLGSPDGGGGGTEELAGDPESRVGERGVWRLDAGGGTVIRGALVSAEVGGIVLEHPVLGTVRVDSTAFKSLELGLRSKPPFGAAMGWKPVPMPEPRLGGD